MLSDIENLNVMLGGSIKKGSRVKLLIMAEAWKSQLCHITKSG